MSRITSKVDDSESLIDQFREECEIRDLAKKTAKDYCYIIHLFVKFSKEAGLNIQEIDRKILKSYLSNLRNKDLKQSSISKNFSAINTFFEFLVEEEYVAVNPIPSFLKHYFPRHKEHDESQMRQIISNEQATRLVSSILDTRDKAVVVLLLKTGIRRNELSTLDVEDVDLAEMTIKLKLTAKRSNRIVYFDSEAADALRRWLKLRESRNVRREKALFLSKRGTRLTGQEIQRLVKKHAEHVDLHDPASDKLEDRFTPHCCRHWFTTSLIRADMPRDFVKELRGDSRQEAIDIYNHIDRRALKESYLAHIPQLGI